MQQQRWFVYIVQCADNTLYTGATPNVEKRLHAHNSGHGAKYTHNRAPVLVRYVESVVDKSEALKREATIKKLTRVQKLALIAAAQTQ